MTNEDISFGHQQIKVLSSGIHPSRSFDDSPLPAMHTKHAGKPIAGALKGLTTTCFVQSITVLCNMICVYHTQCPCKEVQHIAPSIEATGSGSEKRCSLPTIGWPQTSVTCV